MTPDPITFLSNATEYIRNSDKNLKNAHINNTLTIHIACWGEYLNLLEDILLPSLFQKKNIPGIIANKFNVHILAHCLEYELNKIINIFNSYSNISGLDIEVITHQTQNSISKNSLNISLEIANHNNSYLLLAGPDIFYSDGSILNSLKISKTFQAAVSIPHLRTSGNFINEIAKNLPCISSKKLVKIAFDNPHQNTSTAFTDQEQTSSFISGITIYNISPKNYLMIHRLPSVGIFPVTKTDLEYFNERSLTQYDHE